MKYERGILTTIIVLLILVGSYSQQGYASVPGSDAGVASVQEDEGHIGNVIRKVQDLLQR